MTDKAAWKEFHSKATGKSGGGGSSRNYGVNSADYAKGRNGAYGEDVGGSYATAVRVAPGKYEHGWHAGERETQDRARAEEKTKAKDEAERQARDKVAQDTAGDQGNAAVPRKKGEMSQAEYNAWAAKQIADGRERDRIAKTAKNTESAKKEIKARDEKLDALQADVRALSDRADPKRRLKSGGTFPKLSDLLQDTGPARAAMERLDQVKKYAWINYRDKPTATTEVLKIYKAKLFEMTAAVMHINERSRKDLAQIIKGHDGNEDKADLLRGVRQEITACYTLLDKALALFNRPQPEFVLGLRTLVGALRAHQNACDKVDDWANEAIDAAKAKLDVAITARDALVDVVGVCVIVLGAPEFGAAVLVGVVKAGMKYKDYEMSGKKAPLGEIALEAFLDLVATGVASYFEHALEKQLRGRAVKWLATAFPKIHIPDDIFVEAVGKTLTEAVKIILDEAKSMAKPLYEKRPADKADMPAWQYLNEEWSKHFTVDYIWVFFSKRLLDNTKDVLKLKAANGRTTV